MIVSFISENQRQLLFLRKHPKLCKGKINISSNLQFILFFYSDHEDVSKGNANDDSSDDDNDKEEEDDDAPTDNISGDEFIPTRKNLTGKSLTKGSRVFAKWVDGHFYPGIIGNIHGEK